MKFEHKFRNECTQEYFENLRQKAEESAKDGGLIASPFFKHNTIQV